MEVLLDGGANINVTDLTGTTPLHEAATQGYADAVQVTLEPVFFTCLINRFTGSFGLWRSCPCG